MAAIAAIVTAILAPAYPASAVELYPSTSRTFAPSCDASGPGLINSKIGSSAFGLQICVDSTETGPRNVARSPGGISPSSDRGALPAGKLEAGPPAAICQWIPAVNPVPADSPLWEGNDPATGSVEQLSCASPSTDGGAGSSFVETRFVPSAQPGAAAPPPPDPAVLAQQAYRELQIPAPSIGAGPDRTKIAVNLWTWLWVDDPGPQTVTVAAGGVSVTATATLDSTTWTLGEPATPAGVDGFQAGSPVSITCEGAGVAAPENVDWKQEPPCGHRFNWRSLGERTNGSGAWPITATTNWAVEWVANTGETGGTTLTGTSADALEVGEYRILLVHGE